MLIDRLSIIGVGLIGGSLARALRKQNACGHITGYGRSSEHLQEAVDLGVIDDFSLSMDSAVKAADMIVLATPLKTTEPLLKAMRPYLAEDAVITDVGSAKGSVVEAAHATLNDFLPRFVPGHPIAGKEKSGVSASTADLFQSHRVILTPLPETSVSAIDKVRQMWELCGAEVVQLEVKQHDEILAATSHLPHMLAYALVDCLAGMRERDEIFRFAAGGFADFTRIASSDPQMWHDICIANRAELLRSVEAFGKYLENIRSAIEKDDSETLLDIFSRAKETRDRFTRTRDKRNDSTE